VKEKCLKTLSEYRQRGVVEDCSRSWRRKLEKRRVNTEHICCAALRAWRIILNIDWLLLIACSC